MSLPGGLRSACRTTPGMDIPADRAILRIPGRRIMEWSTEPRVRGAGAEGSAAAEGGVCGSRSGEGLACQVGKQGGMARAVV